MAGSSEKTHYNFALIVTILVMAAASSVMSTDIYAPSLPALPEYFDTSAEMVKLTISLNVLMFGLGQLLLGPLSDRFGRRPVLLYAMLSFSIFSFLCSLALNIEQLIIARMIQGMSASAEAVICLAVFQDLFDEKQQVKGFAIFGMAIALAPAIAPIMGGYIHIYLGWQYSFYLITAAGLFSVFLIWRKLPESTVPDKEALNPAIVMENYRDLLVNRQFMLHCLLLGIAVGVIYVFVTGAPFILIQQMGIATEHFGYYQAIIVVAFFIASLISNRAIEVISADRLLGVGLVLMILGGCSLIVVYFSGLLTSFSFAFCYSIMVAGMGPIFSVAPSKAMQATKRSAGASAALLGAIEMIVGGLAAGMVSIFHDGTAMPLVATIAGLMFAVLLIWSNLRKL